MSNNILDFNWLSNVVFQFLFNFIFEGLVYLNRTTKTCKYNIDNVLKTLKIKFEYVYRFSNYA